MTAMHHQFFRSGPMYRHVKFTVASTKGEPRMQISKLELVDGGGNVFQWPSSSMSVSMSAGASYNSGEGPEKIFDGSVDTKGCILTAGFPFYIAGDLGKPLVDPKVWTKWRWYTANDSANRDPKSFSLSFSADGVEWIVVDSVSNFYATSTRKTVAYTGDIQWGGVNV